ncbi:hypothetical protein KI387_026699, partial [Taxus chinensis]
CRQRGSLAAVDPVLSVPTQLVEGKMAHYGGTHHSPKISIECLTNIYDVYVDNTISKSGQVQQNYVIFNL